MRCNLARVQKWMRRFQEEIRSDGGIVEGVTRKFHEQRGGGVAWNFRGDEEMVEDDPGSRRFGISRGSGVGR